MSVSVRAIARKLRVSATTVSLALRHSPRISPRMRMRVLRTAERLGYVPNSKLNALMNEVRLSGQPDHRGTLGLVSLYPEEQPWQKWPHLAKIVKGATEQAHAHGYSLDAFWLRAPNMTARRMQTILQTRGVEGVFCVGAETPGMRFPRELADLPMCTQGVSIAGDVTRVMSNYAQDARTLLIELYRRGYQRPALTIETEGDRRTDFAYSNTYAGLAGRLFRDGAQPILRCPRFDAATFGEWFQAHRPDVIIVHQAPAFTLQVHDYLRRQALRVPEDVGLAMLDMTPDPACYSGIRQNFEVIGACAIDALLTKVLLPRAVHHDFPTVELIPSTWNEGATLRRRTTGTRLPSWLA